MSSSDKRPGLSCTQFTLQEITKLEEKLRNQILCLETDRIYFRTKFTKTEEKLQSAKYRLGEIVATKKILKIVSEDAPQKEPQEGEDAKNEDIKEQQKPKCDGLESLFQVLKKVPLVVVDNE